MTKKCVKERIIETASRLFYTEGYNQTGINQIIREAEVAKASMYQHFRSKEEIVLHYLERRHLMWMGKLNDFTKHAPSGKAKVIASFDFLEDWLTETDFRGCGFQNIITDLPKGHESIKQKVLEHKNELRDWFRLHLKQEPSLCSEQSDELSDEILVLMEGAIILSQIQAGAWPSQTAKRACETLLKTC